MDKVIESGMTSETLDELCHHAWFHIHYIYGVQEDTTLNFLIGETLGIVSNIPKTWNF